MKKHRTTLTEILFRICLKKFADDGWKIKKNLNARTGIGKTLAHVADDTKEIVMYPRVIDEKDPPLEMTLLHELLHIGLDLSGDYDTLGVTYWMERYMWRKLTVEQKAVLTKMLEDA